MRKTVERDLARIERILPQSEDEVTNDQAEKARLAALHTDHQTLLERLRCLNYTAHSARTHASADKAGKLLAWLIQRDCERKPIMEIRSQTGEIVYTPAEIQTEFIKHYTALYTSKATPGEDPSAEFLTKVKLPNLESDQIETLEAPLDLEEIKASIKDLNSDITQIPQRAGSLLRHFAQVSGLKVNWSKSGLFPFYPTLPDPRLTLAEQQLIQDLKDVFISQLRQSLNQALGLF
ncbi:hypothetical protein NDU88_008177 [Pleurodeles waltl]|uniref:Uncharacterized protein n=1 Tax=Pleurodeles waltl TaxID=8319 RepID=A0AAV7SUK8_PLEWA|nr:hypothetical protein NDU88_008177 [Pleurodeles waltl]